MTNPKEKEEPKQNPADVPLGEQLEGTFSSQAEAEETENIAAMYEALGFD